MEPLFFDRRQPVFAGDIVRNRVTGFRIVARKIIGHPQSLQFTILGEIAYGQENAGKQGFIENFYAQLHESRRRISSSTDDDESGAWATPTWEEP